MKYEYTGTEPRFYTDVTGHKLLLKKGDVFELKGTPDCDNIVEYKKKKVKEDVSN